MKQLVAAIALTVWLAPSGASANERLGGTAAGALAGALVLGPIGAVAGAAIGYAVTPAITGTRGAGHALPPPERTPQPQRENSTAATAAPAAAPLPRPRPAALAARAEPVRRAPPQAGGETPNNAPPSPAKTTAQTDATDTVPH